MNSNIDYSKLIAIELDLKKGEPFTIPSNKNFGNERVYLEEDYHYYMLTSSSNYNHESIGEAYVNSNPELLEHYNYFVECTGNHSYKDYMIYKLGAVATIDRKFGGTFMCQTPDRGPLKSICSAYLQKGYEYIEPPPLSKAIIRGKIF